MSSDYSYDYDTGDSNSSHYDNCHSSKKMRMCKIQNSATVPKMYINPHFNQANIQSHAYFNPNFYPELYKDKVITEPVVINTVSKIHVNPKFVNVNKLQNDLVKQREMAVDVVTGIPNSSAALDPPKLVTSSFPTTSSSHASQSKYKLVRNNKPTVLLSTSSAAPSTHNKTTVKISKYKTVSLQKLLPNVGPVVNIKPVSNKTNARSTYKWIAKDENSTNKTIDRRKYKLVSKNVQIPKVVNMNITLNKPISNLISIRGRKFAVTNKTLKLVGHKADTSKLNNIGKLKVRINGKTYVQKSQYLFVRKPAEVDREKLKKNNIPCPLFRRYGKCAKKEKGRCLLLHDSRHVAICRRFLKGQCDSEQCFLSHEVSAEKMPTCSFYLQGCCVRESCPYLHVKVSDSADICTDFLKGYCLQGDKCTKRHKYVCPEFDKHGKCVKSTCPYPHRKEKEKIDKNMLLNKKAKTPKVESRTETPNIDVGTLDCNAVNKRYFIRAESMEGSSSGLEIQTTRVKLGTLPSYIKL